MVCFYYAHKHDAVDMCVVFKNQVTMIDYYDMTHDSTAALIY